ncbi:NAD(P)-dependent oxidoreductase [Gryllotalpicola protaetiae]|uniref:NAD(P)-dependent oxidoreductase n=1 Tax=Gryllotalpicola protaetiae TaxID=2419771 RepID=A0A387BQ49_9MICO|nr:NAD(P)-dependent oxidoreductase [Gryllotalpicola protaetiae]AYG03147.1 NAD(P)-dependent oxidoreductase [Gryllotalpicola protaetiae]
MTAAAALRVGLVGCGNMGAAIAETLAAKCSLSVFDLDRDRRGTVSEKTGAAEVSSLVGLVPAADFFVLSLPSPSISAAVIDELLPELAPGAVIIETSTVSPSDVVAAHTRCAARGIPLVDAAILSGVAQMAQGASTLLIGGDDDDVRAAGPVLDALTADQLRFGAPGGGMAAKIGNNAVSHAVMVVLVESATMLAASGVPLESFGALLGRPDAGLLRPLTHRLMERVAAGDYAGGMPMEAARKDSTLALALAQKNGVPLFGVQAAHTVYEIAVSHGLGRDDYAAIASLWEGWTGTTLRTGAAKPGEPA